VVDFLENVSGESVRVYARRFLQRLRRVQRAVRGHLACNAARLLLLGHCWRREEMRMRAQSRWRKAMG